VDAELPIVVLIDRGSASASEILAAALGESGRAYLLGEQTYGKGSVQQVRHFDERAIKVTTSHYLTPSGASINEVGVTPHQELAEPEQSEEDKADLEQLFESGRVRAFVRRHPDPSAEQIDAFLEELQQSEVGLPARLLRRMVRDEVVRRMPAPPVYDLRFDPVLQEAVRLLGQGLVPAHDAHQLLAPAAAAS
jgi:carboxyl-terminal processing protease